jgi:hypothetical protein
MNVKTNSCISFHRMHDENVRVTSTCNPEENRQNYTATAAKNAHVIDDYRAAVGY